MEKPWTEREARPRAAEMARRRACASGCERYFLSMSVLLAGTDATNAGRMWQLFPGVMPLSVQ